MLVVSYQRGGDSSPLPRLHGCEMPTTVIPQLMSPVRQLCKDLMSLPSCCCCFQPGVELVAAGQLHPKFPQLTVREGGQ